MTAALEHLLPLSVSQAVRLTSRVLTIVSLGSVRMHNAPYRAAALNPYPLVPMFMFGTVLLIFCFVILLLLSSRWVSMRFEVVDVPDPARDPRPTALNSALRWLQQPVGRWGFILVCFATCLMMLPLVGLFSILSNAVLIRTIYETDRDIVAPYLTSVELVQLQADFVSIQSQAQYVAVMKRISDIAAAHHVQVHSYE